jgi:uncharacterized membrane protein YoaK (UPF0700 family)
MLSKFSNTRSLEDNLRLAVLTAFTAGMVNVASFMIFFSFSSNVTGYYAILAAELAKGNLYQAAVVFAWIFLFFLGSFVANIIVINFNQKNTYLAHATPIILEILCLVGVGVYGQFFYKETLNETEALLSLMLFAMGLQNGLTASISNFAVKTTHLTGATTDMGILFSMFTQKQFRENKELKNRAYLLISITATYVLGAVLSGITYIYFQFKLFYLISCVLLIVILYDFYKLKITKYVKSTKASKYKKVKFEDIKID